MSNSLVSYEFVQCRDTGHRWECAGIESGKRQGVRTYVRILTCACGTWREDHYSGWELVGRTYRYPEGYWLGERPDKADLVRESFKREKQKSFGGTSNVVSIRKSNRKVKVS